MMGYSQSNNMGEESRAAEHGTQKRVGRGVKRPSDDHCHDTKKARGYVRTG
jgi:hypothetical protein